MDMKHIHTFESFLYESQRFISFVHSRELVDIKPLTVEEYYRNYPGGAEFDATLSHFGTQTKGVWIFVLTGDSEVERFKKAVDKYGVFGLWTVDSDDNKIYIARD